MKYYIIGLLLLSLAGCVSGKLYQFHGIDQTEKTMTVPVGSSYLLGPLKGEMQKAGWKLVIDGGPVVTRGRLGPDTDLQTGVTYRTKYRLALNQVWLDKCTTGGDWLNFDLTVVDNDSGEEAMTMSGRDCTPWIMKTFMNALNGKSPRI